MKLAFLCSPVTVASLELKILARLCVDHSEQPELSNVGAKFAFLAKNLSAIAMNLDRLDDSIELAVVANFRGAN